MPRKIFVAGEILTAADVNTNLMDQAVMVFDDSAARTTAIPTPSEGMVTYLKDTNAVEKYDGSSFVNIDTTGKILQVLSATKTDAFSGGTSNSYITVPDLTVTITPSSTSSKIAVFVSVPITYAQTADRGVFVSVFADGTNLAVPDSPGNRVPGQQSINQNGLRTAVVYDHFSGHFLHSPNTTSAVVYDVRVNRTGGNPVLVNRGDSDADTADNGRGVSIITVMEVAG